MFSFKFLAISPQGMELIFGLDKGSISKPILDFTNGVWDFIVETVDNLNYVASLLASFSSNILGYFGWLPDSVITLLVTLFGVVAVYMLAGRK